MVRLPVLVVVLAASCLPAAAVSGLQEDGSDIVGVYPEFLRSGGLVLGFAELIDGHRETLVDIVRALDDRIPVFAIVANGAQARDVRALLKRDGAPTTNLSIVQVPVHGMWVRDFGPAFVRLPEGQIVALDAIYGRQDHPADEWVPRYLAGYFRLPVVDVPLRVPGGNFLANGEGWIFTTSQLIEFNGKDGYTQAEIGSLLGSFYGATDWVVLEPLVGEPTQHVDMFLTLVAPNVAVLSQIDPEVDPINARILEDAAAQLAAVRTRSGPMKVERVPMPSHADGKWRSYTNVIFAGGTLLVPSYPDASPEIDEVVLEVYRRLLPEWRVVPVDASSIIQNNGSLHCISINVPLLEH
jgi:agmatine/peptidylarginine deiminase